MDAVLLTLVVAAVVVLLATAAAYNGLGDLRQDVRLAWAQIDGQLRRRYDLLPALTAAARSTGEPVPAPLAAALAAKNQATVAFNPGQLAAAEAGLTAGLRDLFAAPSPALAASPAYAGIRAELLAVDATIDGAGRRYNDAVHAYNATLHSFPHDVAAAVFGFKPQPLFEVPPPEVA